MAANVGHLFRTENDPFIIILLIIKYYVCQSIGLLN